MPEKLNELITTAAGTGRAIARSAGDIRLDHQALKVRIGEYEIEIPLRDINIILNQQSAGGRRPADYFRCGNCMAKLPKTGDPEQDHHTAMRHRVEHCMKSGVAVSIENRILREEFDEQPHVEMTRRLLGAPQPPARKKLFGLF